MKSTNADMHECIGVFCNTRKVLALNRLGQIIGPSTAMHANRAGRACAGKCKQLAIQHMHDKAASTYLM